MPQLRPAKIIQALVLFDGKNSVDYGLALWTAFHEVENFYRAAPTQIEYRRYYIAPSIPSASFFETITHTLGKVLPGAQTVNAFELLKQAEIRSPNASSAELVEPNRRTYDQRKIADVIRNQIDPDGMRDHLMIVTDRPITPPPRWRYIISDPLPDRNASVISVAPLDPEYWRDKDPQRITTIKNRVRNIMLSVTGHIAGLEYCGNPSCFLVEQIDSTTMLDDMYELGEEHGIPELQGRRFDNSVSNPASVQRVIENPARRRF